MLRTVAAVHTLRPWNAAHTKATEVLMSFRFASVVTFALLLMSPSSGRTQVLMERDVSLHMALTIAETALAQCGVRTSVAVVDRAGRLRVFLQGLYGSDLPTDVGRVGDAHRNNTFRAANACRRHSARRRRPDQSRRGHNRRRRPERSPDGRGSGGGLCQGRHRQSSGSTSVRLAATCLDFDL
jgi:hypothetical protein